MRSASYPAPRRRPALTAPLVETDARGPTPVARTRPLGARARALPKGTPLARPGPWLAGALAANVLLYVMTVAHEASLTQWRGRIAQQMQQNVQLRTSLSAARSLSWIDTRAKSLGLVKPAAIAYLPPPVAAPPPRPAGPIGLGATEGF